MIVDTTDYNQASGFAEPTSVWPSALKWGAIAGAIGCVITLISYNIGMMDVGDDGQPASTWPVTILSMVVYAVLIYLGLKSYRDTENAGFLTYGRAVLWSLAFGVGLGVVSSIFIVIFYQFLAPNYLPDMIDVQVGLLEEQGVSDEQAETMEAGLKWVMNPWVMALTGFFGSIVLPLLIGLGVGAALKTPPRY